MADLAVAELACAIRRQLAWRSAWSPARPPGRGTGAHSRDRAGRSSPPATSTISTTAAPSWRRVPRPLHILVALDWVQNRAGRRAMERACRAAGWPVVLRPTGAGRGRHRRGGPRLAPGHARSRRTCLRAGRVAPRLPRGLSRTSTPATRRSKDEAAFLPSSPASSASPPSPHGAVYAFRSCRPASRTSAAAAGG